MNALSKQRSVFSISSKTRMMPKNTVPFDTEVDGEESVDCHVFFVDKALWDDMGQPHEITVTIEPGDTLNANL